MELNESVITFSMVPIKFGFNLINEVGFEVKRLGAKTVLMCVDPAIKPTGYPGKIRELIEKENISVEVYEEFHIEPTSKSIEKMVGDLKGKDFDLYLAIGGGSTIDTTKIANLLLSHPAPIMDYINKPIGGGKAIPGPLKPMLAMPTTAGTGSEMTSVAVLDLVDINVKTGISHPYLKPTLALCDPLFTVTLSPEITASTGMDALAHAMESYTSLPYDMRKAPADPSQRAVYIGANPISDLYSEKAIEYVGKYLRRAVAAPYDLEARWHIMAAATFAGIGFGNAGVHIPHAMAYPLAGLAHKYKPAGYDLIEPMTPHGTAVSLTMPAAFRFTSSVWPEKHGKAAKLLGADLEDISDAEAAFALPDAIINLMKDIGFPNGISALGYSEIDIPRIVEGTMQQQRLLSGCPKNIGQDELTEVAREAMTYW